MKKLISILLCLALLAALPCSALATSDEFLTIGAIIDSVVDEADLISDEAESDLTQKAYEIYNEYGIWVSIVTVPSLGYKTAEAYADDYYDQNYYSMYPDGVLLLISMEYRDWAISTCGRGIDLLTDWELDSLFDSISGYLANNEFDLAFDAYLDYLPNYLVEKEACLLDYVRVVVVALIVGVIIAFFALSSMKSAMNTAVAQASASDYIVDGSFELPNCRDIYLYSNVTRTAKPKDTSTHRSSGGISHGGRSGKF